MKKEHSEEILKVECLEYSSPSWTRPKLANDQAIKWAKAEVFVHSVPCLGQTNDSKEATERWKGPVEDFKKYSSYQAAVGLVGQPIVFKWKISRIFVFVSSSRDPERLGDEEHQARRLQGPDHLHVNVQRH